MGSNIFNGDGKSKEEQNLTQKVEIQSKTILKLIENLKTLEDSNDLLTQKIEMIDKNSVENFKKYFNDLKDLRESLKEVKREIENIKQNQKKIVKQLKLTSTKDEVKKLEKYIDFWEPVNFVTREEFDNYKKELKEQLTKVIEEFLKG